MTDAKCGGAPEISIIIPTFNRQRETLSALASALANAAELAPLQVEILVIDDGSQPSFSLPLAALPTNVLARLIRLDENKGAAAARNRGVAEAAGAWLAFLDSDDQWAPGKLAAQWDAATRGGNAPDALVAWSCTAHFDGLLRKGSRTPVGARTLTEFAAGCWFSPGSTLLIGKSAFEFVGRYDEGLRRLEDYDWFLRFAVCGGQLVVVSTGLAQLIVGPRRHYDAVCAAADRIRAKYARLDAPAAATVIAFLDLERARAAFAECKWLSFMRFLASSWLAKPRFRIQVGRFWA